MGLVASLPKVYRDGELLLSKDRSDPPLCGQAEADSVPDHGNASEAHADGGGVERNTCPADGCHDPAPIGVLAEERSFNQIRRSDGLCDLSGLRDGSRSGDCYFDDFGHTLTVAAYGQRQRLAGLR